MLQQPSEEVLLWFSGQPREEMYATAITAAEIGFGIEILPEGKRKATLDLAAQRMFNALPPCLPFDGRAAAAYAALAASRVREGKALAVFDLQIAAIAQTLAASVATRNLRDFAGLGLNVVNPWNRLI